MNPLKEIFTQTATKDERVSYYNSTSASSMVANCDHGKLHSGLEWHRPCFSSSVLPSSVIS